MRTHTLNRLLATTLTLLITFGFPGGPLLPVNVFAASSSFNKQINYQGKLSNSSGSTVSDGDYNMIFRLYAASSGGSALWTEVYTSTTTQVTVTSGLFSTLLGQITSLSSFDFNRDLYLSVNVGGTTTPAVWDGEMSPRKRLGTVPSAFEADKIDGLDSSQLVRTDDSNAIASSSASTLLSLSQTGAGAIFTAASSAGTALVVTNAGNVGIATTSPYARLTAWGASTGNIIEAVTSASSTALRVSGEGFATTTVTGLTVNGSATSTANVGWNLTAGCYAINGTCVGGSGLTGSGAANRAAFWTAAGNLSYDDAFTWDNTNKRLGLGTTSPFANLAIDHQAGEVAFVIGSTTKTNFIVDSDGKVAVGTSSARQVLTVQGKGNTPWLAVMRQTQADGSSSDEQFRIVNAEATGYTPRSGLTSNSWTNVIDSGNSNLMLSTTLSGGTGGKIILDGNVGIGTLAPLTALDVVGVINTDTGFSISNGATSGFVLRGNAVNFVSARLQVTDVGGGTAGSVIFSNGTILTQDNSNLFWDNTDKRFGLGTSSPYAALSVAGASGVVAEKYHATNTSATSTFGYLTAGRLDSSGSATNTAAQGWNITAGCYAINGTCLSGTTSNLTYDWQKETNYGALALTPSTTIPVWLKSQLYSSSSAIFASSVTADRFTATNTSATSTFGYLTAGRLDSSGAATNTAAQGWNITAGCFAINGTCVGGTSGNSFGQTFEITNGALSPTTTLGIVINAASSTITNLSVINATTTNATSTNSFATTASSTNLFSTTFQTGNATSSGYLAITGSATNTATRGFNITAGCYALNGICLSSSGVTGSGAATRVTFWDGTSSVTSTSTFLWDNTDATGGRLTLGNSAVATSSARLVTYGDLEVNSLRVGRGGGNQITSVAVGNEALLASVSNTGNTAVGYRTLKVAGGSSFLNTAVGASALSVDVSGNSNTAVGGESLLVNNGGASNTSVGAYTMYTNTAGDYNTAVGSRALFANIAAHYNTAVGYNSLVATDSGGYNVGLGYQAGGNNSAGTYNTFIGTLTGGGITTGGKNTILGANVTGLAAALSNTIILADGDGNKRLYIDSSGNVGIGTSSPYARLTAWGASTGNIFEAVTSASTTALRVSGEGFATTTVTGLTVSGSASSTANVGWNITTGCYAINGICVGGSSGNSFGQTFEITNGALSPTTTLGIVINAASSTITNLSVINSTTTNATSTNSFATTASSTNLFSTTFQTGNATSSGYLAITGSATNTATRGFNITAGCYALNGICLSSSGVTGSGAATRVTFWDGTSSVTSTSTFLWDNTDATGGRLTLGNSAVATSSARLVAYGDISVNSLTVGRGGANQVTSAALGNEALLATDSGVSNTAVGYRTLKAARSSSFQNTAVGASALPVDVSGYHNTALGAEALLVNNGGAINTAVGALSMYSNTGGNYNTAVGSRALFANIGAHYNTAVGYNSLVGTDSGGYNVGLGYQAGPNHTAGTYNTFIGTSAGGGITTGGKNTIIGANIAGLAAGLSNTIILGDGDGNKRIYIDSSGNVGIATTSPYARLTAWGASTGNILEAVTSASSTALRVSGEGFATTTVTGLTVNGSATSTANVGWNITAGCYAINGTCLSSSAITGSGAANRAAFWTAAGNLSYDDTFVWDNTNKRLGIGTTSPWGDLSIEQGTANPSFVVSNQGSSSPSIFVGGVNQNGYVGIGTSTPLAPLHVAGGQILNSISSGTGKKVNTFSLGSGAKVLAIDGSYIYVVDDGANDLKVIDITDPLKPAQIGSVTIAIANSVYGVVAQGRRVYVGADGFLKIFDVSNPSVPTLISTLSLSAGAISDLAVSGRYAYLTDNSDNVVYVVDIANAYIPKLISTISGTNPYAVVVVDSYLYVLDSVPAKLWIYDVSNPVSPLLRGSLAMDDDANDIVVSGRYAYIPDRQGSGPDYLHIVDVSNPASPSLVVNVSHPWDVIPKIVIAGKYAYLANQSGSSINVFDVSSSTNPYLVDDIGIGGAAKDVVISGNYLFALDSTNNYLVTASIAGIQSGSANIGSLETGMANVRNDLSVQNYLRVKDGISVGSGGINSVGPISAGVATTTSGTPFSAHFQGFVGIGTTSPYAALSVVGSTGVVADKFHATNTTATSTFGYLTAQRLDSSGSATNTASQGWNLTAGCYAINGSCTGGSHLTGSGAANRAAFWTAAGNLSYDDTFTWDNTNKRLGIGTTSPYAMLSVAGEIVGRNFVATSTTATSTFAGAVGIGTTTPEARLVTHTTSGNSQVIISTNDDGSVGNPSLLFQGDYDGTPRYAHFGMDTAANVFRIVHGASFAGSENGIAIISNGNVGIASSTPWAKLSVTNTGAGPSFMVEDATSPDSSPFIIDADGKVGIGTTSPYAALSVVGSTGVVAEKFHATSSTATSTFMGGVEIGTTTAARNWKLTVQGGICVTSGSTCPANETTGGITVDTDDPTPDADDEVSSFDLAERYPASEVMAAGEIAELDLDSPDKAVVKRASLGPNNVLIGIVSTAPAIAISGSHLSLGPGREATSTRPMLALTGRVPVRVNLENGRIVKGDLITASSEPGVGKKAKDGEQSVGIALDDWNNEEEKDGKVLVFINLSAPRLSASINADAISFPDGGMWSLSSSGAIISAADLNMNGRALKSVSAIASASGNWSIDEAGVLRAKELHAEKLCLGETCVTESELRSLMQAAGLAVPLIAEDSSAAQSTEPVIEEASTTEPVIVETEPVTAEPVVVPEPDPELTVI